MLPAVSKNIPYSLATDDSSMSWQEACQAALLVPDITIYPNTMRPAALMCRRAAASAVSSPMENAASAVSSPMDSAALSARSPEDDVTWNEAIQKGNLRHALVNAPPMGKDISSFAQYSDLVASGWTSTLERDQSWQLESDVFDAIATQFHMQQKKTTKADTVHKYTGAEYRGWFSASPYIVFSMDNHSPRARKSGNTTPDLEHWSDVAFLDYQQSLAEQDDLTGMTKLSLMVSGKINREADIDIIEMVISQLGIQSAEISHTLAFPGTSVTPGSSAFLALVGTANGGGIARFLSDHKSSLDWKCIQAITIVHDPKPGLGIDPKTRKRPTAYWLLFHIANHPDSPTKRVDRAAI